MAKRTVRSRPNKNGRQGRVNSTKKNGHKLLSLPTRTKNPPLVTQRKTKLSLVARPSVITTRDTREIQRRQAKQSVLAEQSLKTRTKKTVCKSRPDSSDARKGSGGSKTFVPWCERKS